MTRVYKIGAIRAYEGIWYDGVKLLLLDGSPPNGRERRSDERPALGTPTSSGKGKEL